MHRSAGGRPLGVGFSTLRAGTGYGRTDLRASLDLKESALTRQRLDAVLFMQNK